MPGFGGRTGAHGRYREVLDSRPDRLVEDDLLAVRPPGGPAAHQVGERGDAVAGGHARVSRGDEVAGVPHHLGDDVRDDDVGAGDRLLVDLALLGEG
ncbi:MAG TPA: hypothetical protein VMG13_01440 [Trebonia sp.]|nr:hypothetical protein [Trebonia sp.]